MRHDSLSINGVFEWSHEILCNRLQKMAEIVLETPAPAQPELETAQTQPEPEIAQPVTAATAATAAEEIEPETDKRPLTEGGKEEAKDDKTEEPPQKKRRITRSTINKLLKGHAMLDSSLVTWKDWDEGAEWGDSIFYQCVVHVDVLGADGTTVLLAAGTKVPKVDWLMSKSTIIFYPDGKIASAVACPLSVHQPQLKSVLLEQQQQEATN